MKNIKKPSVIFDMDGVLADSNEAHFKAFRRMGEKIGTPFTRELLEQTVGMHNSQIFPIWLGETIARDEVVRLAAEKELIYREIASRGLSAIPGSVALVRTLHQLGHRLAVGSSGPRANVELAIRTLAIGDYFEAVVTGDDVKHGKPDPEIFLKAATQLGRDPRDCLVIEDAPQGILAARAAGMKVIALTTTRKAEYLSQAHRVVDSPDEITEHLIHELVYVIKMG